MAGSHRRLPLGRAFDTPDAKRAYVRRLFATIADRYDLITVLLSYGRDRRWKKRLAGMARPAPGARVLDLACGTGDIAFEMAARGCRVVGLDITPRMLQIARAKARAVGKRVSFTAGDMLALPFPDGSFSIVTTGYGLRNVPDLTGAVAEIVRVLAPGGVLLSLDFNKPSNPLVRAGYLAYLTLTGSLLGIVLHGDPDTYRYIPASIRRYPDAGELCALMRAAGFRSCSSWRIFGGLMAIHEACK